MRWRLAFIVGLVAVLGAGVGLYLRNSSTSEVSETDAASTHRTNPSNATTPDFVVGGSLPVTVRVPAHYDPTVAAPLLILLHGAAVSGAQEEAYMQLAPVASAKGMLYLVPDGHTVQIGGLLWNATDACCDLSHTGVDDAGYLDSLIAEISAKVKVDPKRIYFVGHSNGGFMSYRMACDHAGEVAAIVSLAGATFATPSACAPSEPVSVLEIHGTNDATISYTGGSIRTVAYPSAETTVQTWAAYDGCSTTADSPPPPPRPISVGDPATVQSYSTGCRPGGHAELWTLAGAPHIPLLIEPTFADQVIEFLLAHPKP